MIAVRVPGAGLARSAHAGIPQVGDIRLVREHPPSQLTTWPVMNEASSEARKTASRATSSGVPRRPTSNCRTATGINSAEPALCSSPGVQIGPGAIALHLTRRGPYWSR